MDIEPGEAGGRAAHRELKEAAPASPPSPRARGHPGLALRSGEKLTGALLPRARSCPPTWGGRAPSPRGTCRSGSGLGSEAQALAPAATGQGFQRVTRAHSALLQGCWKRLEITTHTHTHTHTGLAETHTHTHTHTHTGLAETDTHTHTHTGLAETETHTHTHTHRHTGLAETALVKGGSSSP